ncbi:MAG: hypothetical protein V1875_04925 [Candidatus Altiarchaeota archaeon]
MRACIILLFLLLVAVPCSAIVIVPPLVYVASLSVLAVFLKLLVAFFSWLAVSGLASKGFLKRPAISALSVFLSVAPKLLLAFALAVAFTLLIKPVESRGVLIVCGLTASSSMAVLFLSQFRGIRNSEKRLSALARLAAFGFLVFVICYAAVWTSIEESVRVVPKISNNAVGAVATPEEGINVSPMPSTLAGEGAGA